MKKQKDFEVEYLGEDTGIHTNTKVQIYLHSLNQVTLLWEIYSKLSKILFRT